ncbi:Keratin type II cytoskeletal 8 [Bienertia sinuspersici]
MSHLDHLQRITNDPEVTKNRQQFSDLCSEHADYGNKIQNLEAKLSELTRAFNKCADDIDKLKLEIEKRKSMFLEQVSAPW